MANVQITQLPAAGTLVGTEAVPIVQNGVTVQTTVGAITSGPSLTQTFITVNNEPTLANSRFFSVGSGLSLTDNGAQSNISIGLTGALANFNTLGTGIVAKTGVSTLANRTITAGTVGLSLTNGDGVSGNPTVSLTGAPLTLAQIAGSGMLSISSGTVNARQLTGTANQITIADGTGGGDPTFSIADNPILPGTASVKVPSGTTGQRPAGSNGQVRYNTTNNQFEFYENGTWVSYGSGSGSVTSVGMTVPTGLSVSGSPITNSGTFGVTYTAGYSIPTTASQSNWDTAYTLATTAVQSVSGTANQITSSGTTAITLAIAGNPVMPGTAAITVPIGTTAQRGSVGDGAIRYNSDNALFEGRINGTWSNFALAGVGVTSVATGTGLTGGPITSTGTISIANTGVSANTYGSQNEVPVFAVNAQGQITSVTNTAINSVSLTTGTISTTPSSANDIVNKAYADSIASGINFHQACVYATTVDLGTVIYNNGTSGVGATLTKDTPFSTLAIDGHTFVSPTDIGKRVLIKDETNSAYNGVYTVTNVGSGSVAWVLTRATDFDTAGSGVDQIDAGDFFLITSGTTNGNTSWVQQTPLPIIVGTTAIVFNQFGSSTTYSAGTGLSLVGTTFSLSTPVSIANGGTGQTTANAALNALLPAQTNNTFLKSNGTNTSFASLPTYLPVVTHVGSTVQVSVANGYLTVLLNNGVTYVNITVF
jgi:trimeric autotransporter adhesin